MVTVVTNALCFSPCRFDSVFFFAFVSCQHLSKIATRVGIFPLQYSAFQNQMESMHLGIHLIQRQLDCSTSVVKIKTRNIQLTMYFNKGYDIYSLFDVSPCFL